MSITRVYSVFCDIQGDLCHGWIAESTEGAAAARREAAAAGWRRTGGKDRCPGCHSGERRPRTRFS